MSVFFLQFLVKYVKQYIQRKRREERQEKKSMCSSVATALRCKRGRLDTHTDTNACVPHHEEVLLCVLAQAVKHEKKKGQRQGKLYTIASTVFVDSSVVIVVGVGPWRPYKEEEGRLDTSPTEKRKRLSPNYSEREKKTSQTTHTDTATCTCQTFHQYMMVRQRWWRASLGTM